MNTVCFKARFVTNTTIKARNKNGRYKDKQVSLVKIGDAKADMKALRKISELWCTESNYAETILIDYYYRTTNEDLTIYALTEQKNAYRKLIPEMVLGLTELEKNPDNYKISYLQTRPDCIHSKRKKPFKKIGESLLKFIISATEDKKVFLNSVLDAVDFYKKYGFKMARKDAKENLMVLKKLRHKV